jgi:hypothetical protein
VLVDAANALESVADREVLDSEVEDLINRVYA